MDILLIQCDPPLNSPSKTNLGGEAANAAQNILQEGMRLIAAGLAV
jgi:hypothetical protein